MEEKDKKVGLLLQQRRHVGNFSMDAFELGSKVCSILTRSQVQVQQLAVQIIESTGTLGLIVNKNLLPQVVRVRNMLDVCQVIVPQAVLDSIDCQFVSKLPLVHCVSSNCVG